MVVRWFTMSYYMILKKYHGIAHGATMVLRHYHGNTVALPWYHISTMVVPPHTMVMHMALWFHHGTIMVTILYHGSKLLIQRTMVFVLYALV